MAAHAKVIQSNLHMPALPMNNDRIVFHTEVGQDIRLSQLLQLIFGSRLTMAPRKSFERGKALESSVVPGWVHIGTDKEDLFRQRNTKFIRTYETLLQHVANGYQYMTFGTFHTKTRRAADRKRRNLNSVHAFVLDIDSKRWSVSDILEFCSRAGIVPPTFINETIRGYHLWYVLDKEMAGPHDRLKKQSEKKEDITELTAVGSFYNDINRFLLDQFSKAFPNELGGVDPLVGGERYIRIPTTLCYYSGNQYSINDFVQNRKEINIEIPKKIRNKEISDAQRYTKNTQTYTPKKAIVEDPAYRKLLTMQPKEGHRRYTAFTIALLFYALNWSIEETRTWLKQWFESHLISKAGFRWSEIERVIKSAYSGKHNGPYYTWMQTLTGMQAKVFFTRRKSEDERIYKTQDHWQRLFMQLLQAEGGVSSRSNRELCEIIGLSSRAMFETVVTTLIEQGLIRKEVQGRGRSAVTSYFVVQDPHPENPGEENAEKVVSIAAYRERKSLILSWINDPESYRNLSKTNRDGGRDSFDLLDDDVSLLDPGGGGDG